MSAETIQSVDELEAELSEPTPGVVRALAELPGDILVLGVSGKMGPSLARMARRALDQLGRRDRVLGVARFGSPAVASSLEAHGIQTLACDLLERTDVARLPEAPNVVFMAGQKFGTAAAPELTWAVNTLLPAQVGERFSGARIVAFSTGCVYPFAPAPGVGSREEDALNPPGDYANACVGRERLFGYASRRWGTRVALIRLNYAVELRYGVLLDVALKVWRGEPVDVTTGHVNVIWQRDASAMALQCLAHAARPPFVLNVTGPETLSIRAVAERFSRLLGREVAIVGREAPTAWLSDASRARGLFGPPSVDAARLIEWTADWVKRGGAMLGRPTHFEVRDGRF